MGSAPDSVDFWLEAAGKYPLLPHAEMLRLGKIIQDESGPVQARRKAVTKLVRHNLRLIPSIVKRVVGPKRSARFGDTLTEDLLQSGVVGLNRAAEKFDPTLGYSFTTYANMWIYQAVQREATNHTSMIKVPETTIRDYYAVAGRRQTASLDELPEKIRSRIVDAHFAINCFFIEERPASRSSDDYHDVLPSQHTAVADDTFDDYLNLAVLNDMQRTILHMVYRKNFTKKQTAQTLGLSRDRLNRLHDSALRQLRFAISR